MEFIKQRENRKREGVPTYAEKQIEVYATSRFVKTPLTVDGVFLIIILWDLSP